MPLFSVKFERSVTTYETVHRVFDAPDEATAQRHADAMAASFDSNCPDDAQETDDGAEFGDWSAEVGDDVGPTDAPDYRADEIGEPAGCKTCESAVETRSPPCDECGTHDEEE